MIDQVIKPGRLVEIDGEPCLIEEVRLQVTAQRIESKRGEIDNLFSTGVTSPPQQPCFVRIEGTLEDEVFSAEKFKPLYKKDEL